MISHERAEELISARMDAPLTPAEHYELQSHLAACPTCRVFVSQADDIARGLHGMSRLPASPAVSRAVMSAVRQEQSGWAWLSNTLQALSSPGMAAAASLALVVALAGVLYVAINAPQRATAPIVSQGTGPVETISAVTDAPLPTAIPTAIPTQVVETPEPEEPEESQSKELASAATKAPQPTATRTARAVEPAATKAPTAVPTPEPTTAPVLAQEQPAIQPVTDAPVIEPVSSDEPIYEEPWVEDPALAMAEEPVTEPVEIAQQVPQEDIAASQEIIDSAPIEEDVPVEQGAEPEPVVEQASDAPVEPVEESGQGGKKDGDTTGSESAAPEPTRPVGPVPLEAIAALEGAGQAPDINLPPGPVDPMYPDQSFLPVTPTPVTDGTPTPEQSDGSGEVSGSEAPQLAEEYDGDQGITALIPESVLDDVALAEAPVEVAPEDTWTETTNSRNRDGKKDKDRKKGNSWESPQTAYVDEPFAWTGVESGLMQNMPVDLQQEAVAPVEAVEWTEPVATEQESGYPVESQPVYEDPAVYDDGTGYDETAVYDDGTGTTGTGSSSTTTTDAETRQIDPATGMEIDPATGYLIDPTTGYLLDRTNGRVIDPRTSYEVHLQTGLLIDPATGALLDPNTLVVVVPPGFGSDTPAYNPGSPEMRGQIETVVDDNYNNASIRMEPPTDGPVQPIGEIIVPTETGEAVEIS
jgi:hypothetical protein